MNWMRQQFVFLSLAIYLSTNFNQCVARTRKSRRSRHSDKKSNLLVLTDENFDSTIKAKQIVLIVLTITSCDVCKKSVLELETAAKEFIGNRKIKAGTIDCSTQIELNALFSVSEFPHLIYFRDGKQYKANQRIMYNAQSMIRELKRIASPVWDPPPPGVISLTKKMWKSDPTLKAFPDPKLIMFYEPSSQHYKEFYPVYEQAGNILQESNPPINLFQFDASDKDRKTRNLLNKYSIKRLPDFKMMLRGEMIDYNPNKLEEDDIVETMLEFRKPSVKKIRNIADWSDFISTTSPRIVGIYPDLGNEMQRFQQAKQFKEMSDIENMDISDMDVKEMLGATNAMSVLAKEYFLSSQKFLHFFKFATIENLDLCHELGFSDFDVILFHPTQFTKGNKEKSYSFADTFDLSKDFPTADGLGKFYSENQPLVSVLERNMDPRQSGTKLAQVVLYLDIDFETNFKDQKQLWASYQIVLKAAKRFKKFHGVAFYLADITEFSDHVEVMGFDSHNKDGNIVIWQRGNKYPLRGELNDLENFVKSILKSKGIPFATSEEIPKSNQGPVKIVVGQNFDEIVNNPNNDVLLQIYKHHNQKSITFQPIYEKLGVLLEKETHIVIAKINAEKNDIPAAYIPLAYPTIYLVRQRQKRKPLKYDGKKKLSSLVEFLHQEASSTITSVPISYSKSEWKKLKEEL